MKTNNKHLQIDLKYKHPKEYLIALAGNPNTGKSTLFNSLTGLNQHTGNWPGKTVAKAEGRFTFQDNRFKVVDLPGTYSLLTSSSEEEIARNFILFGRPDVTVIVADSTALERNLNLALQILQITDKAILCCNLIDEAERKSIFINKDILKNELGIPVLLISARKNLGIQELLETIQDIVNGNIKTNPRKISYPENISGEIKRLSNCLQEIFPDLPNPEWITLRLMENDKQIVDALYSGSFNSIKFN